MWHRPGFKAATLPILFKAADGAKGLEAALEKLFAEADKAIARRRKHFDSVGPRRLSHERARFPRCWRWPGCIII